MKYFSFSICIIYVWLLIYEVTSNNLKSSLLKNPKNNDPHTTNLKNNSIPHHSVKNTKVDKTYYQKGNHFVVNTESLLDEEKLLLRELLDTIDNYHKMVKNNENDMKVIENQYKAHQFKFKNHIKNFIPKKQEEKVYEPVEIKKSTTQNGNSYNQYIPKKDNQLYTPQFHSNKQNLNNFEKNKVYQNVDVEINKRDPNIKFYEDNFKYHIGVNGNPQYTPEPEKISYVNAKIDPNRNGLIYSNKPVRAIYTSMTGVNTIYHPQVGDYSSYNSDYYSNSMIGSSYGQTDYSTNNVNNIYSNPYGQYDNYNSYQDFQ